MRCVLIAVLCCLAAVGCHKPKGTVLGKPPAGPPRTILAIRSGDTPAQVAVSGVLVEKCPVAGCWFRLRDDTGVMKVDTKAAGFVVANVPLQTKVVVRGKVALEGQEIILEATGLRY